MNAGMSFAAIISLLLAMAIAGDAAKVRVKGVDQATGRARPQAGLGCPPWMCGKDGNHNETLVRDTQPTAAGSRFLTNVPFLVLAGFATHGTGVCPPFACGSDGNHNETLVRDTVWMK